MDDVREWRIISNNPITWIMIMLEIKEINLIIYDYSISYQSLFHSIYSMINRLLSSFLIFSSLKRYGHKFVVKSR